MTVANLPFAPTDGNEPPIDTVLREVAPNGTVHIWYRRDGHWTSTGTPTRLHWADVVSAAGAGSVFTLLYLPAGGAR